MIRFKTHIGHNYNPELLVRLTNEELAKEIKEFNKKTTKSFEKWDVDLLHELCRRANVIQEGIFAEWENTYLVYPEDSFENIALKAAKILGVEVE